MEQQLRVVVFTTSDSLFSSIKKIIPNELAEVHHAKTVQD
jgi:hypothetical protein